MGKLHQLFKVSARRHLDFVAKRVRVGRVGAVRGRQKRVAQAVMAGIAQRDGFELAFEPGDAEGMGDADRKDHRLAQVFLDLGAAGCGQQRCARDRQRRLRFAAAARRPASGGGAGGPEQIPPQPLDLFAVMRADRGVGDAFQRLAQRLVERGLPFRAVEDLALGLALPQEVDHRLRRLKQVAHRLRSARADQVVGVHALGQDHETQAVAGLEHRQRKVHKAHGGPDARGVAVQHDQRFGVDAPEKAKLVFGDRRAKGRDGGVEPRRHQRDHVHVALGDDQRFALARRFARGAVVVKAAALVEKLGFRRIQVLGAVARVHRPAAEGDAAAARVADREHDPVAENVVRRLALGRGFGKAGGQDQVVGDALGLEVIPKPLPAFGGKADLEPVAIGFRQLAAAQVVARRGPRGGAKLHPVMLDSGFHHLCQLAAAVGPLRGLGIARGHLHPRIARQNLDRLHEAHVLGLAQEADGIALGVAAEAVVIALAVVDVETCRLFLVERARRPEIALGLVGLAVVPRHLAPHDARQRRAVPQFVKESGGQAHGGNIGPLGPMGKGSDGGARCHRPHRVVDLLHCRCRHRAEDHDLEHAGFGHRQHHHHVAKLRPRRLPGCETAQVKRHQPGQHIGRPRPRKPQPRPSVGLVGQRGKAHKAFCLGADQESLVASGPDDGGTFRRKRAVRPRPAEPQFLECRRQFRCLPPEGGDRRHAVSDDLAQRQGAAGHGQKRLAGGLFDQPSHGRALPRGRRTRG